MSVSITSLLANCRRAMMKATPKDAAADPIFKARDNPWIFECLQHDPLRSTGAANDT